MKFPIRLVPDDTKIPFMRLRLLNFTLSGLLSVLSIVLFVFVGPDYGIDFRGGTIIEVKPLTQQADIAEIRSAVTGLGLVGSTQVPASVTRSKQDSEPILFGTWGATTALRPKTE